MVKYIYQAVALVFIFAGALFLFGRNMDLEYTFGQRPVVVPRNYDYG